MASYSGPGNFPYWMTIVNTAASANPQAQSENIPVTVGVEYQFDVVCSYATTYTSGVQVYIAWYTANGIEISSSAAVVQSNMTGGVLYEVNSAYQTAPATASYAVVIIQCLGTPAETNPLLVYNATVTDQNGNIVNVNYAFTYTTWPWSPLNGTPTLAWNYNPLLLGDSDSLVIDNVIELMGGAQGVQCLIPELQDYNGQGPTFRILAPPSLNSAAFGYESSYDLNAPQPTQDVVASMLLDGERPFGDRASNRTMSLPIVIFGTQAGGMNQVLKAREYLMSVIDQQTYTIKWTPADTGLPMLFDAFRALPSSPLYGFNYSAGGSATGQAIGRPNYPIAMITLSIQALPYGRSDIDGVQNLSFQSPISGGINPQTVQPSTLDTFGTVLSGAPIISNPTVTEMGFANPTSTSTWNIATGHAIAAGNTSMVEVQAAGGTITSITDTQGNVYKQVAAQSTGGLCIQFIWMASVVNPLTAADHVTITTSGSGNFSSVWSSISGAWTPTVLFQGAETASTFNQTLNVGQYDLVIYMGAGLGSSGNPPFTNYQGNFGNGYNNTTSWSSQALAQTSMAVVATSMPNPSAVIVIALVPANQYWNSDTTTPPPTFIGHSAHYSPPTPFKAPYPAATYTQTVLNGPVTAPVNIVGCPVLSMYFGQAYDTQWPKDPKFVSNVTFQWTLTDDLGRKLSFSKKQNAAPYGTSPSAPKWVLVNSPIPQGKAFNYNSVTSYSVRISNWNSSGHTGYIRMHCWLNYVVANPQTIQNGISPRGTVYQMLALPGSARAPVSVQCQLPAAQNQTKEITTPSTGTWIVPPGVYSVQAEAWAGGGAGAASNLSRVLFGAGGGGGEYAQEPALSVLPGQQVPWSIGGGGTPGQLVNTVVQFNKSGTGHWTCPANVTNVLVEAWGGGGAGGAGAGGGGGGEYAYSHVPVTPGTTYVVCTGPGGKADTGTTTATIASREGSISWFGPPGTTSAAPAYVQAAGGLTSLTGSSSGGVGGSFGTPQQAVSFARTAYAIPSGNVTSAAMGATTSSVLLFGGDTALVVVTVSGAATITVSDTAGNKYTQIATSNNTGAFTYVFACFDAKTVTGRGAVTVKQSVSQHMMALFYDVPGVVGVDVAAVANSGTSSTPSITSNATHYPAGAVLAIFTNTGANAHTTPAGWKYGGASFNGNVSPVLYCDVFEQTAANGVTSGLTCAPTYTSSETWSGIALSLIAVNRWAGGRGGTSPGPSGGGGGGAGGADAVGGAGGNSQAYVANVGNWQQGGAGGTGQGQGGAGGAGANTPGFPGVGVQPGGGGGGGYQTAPIFNPANPSKALPGTVQTNYLGADGGTGLVQLTYAVGSGSPVNGGNTTFGSTALTGTVVTAHGGNSAANNSAAGATGGTGSSNTIHNAGGPGGILVNSTLGSYMGSPTQGYFTTLTSGSWDANSVISGASSASVSQGVAVVLIESQTEVLDLVVTDSAGNLYQLAGLDVAAPGAWTVYAYVADIEYPITTSTTLSVASATSQNYALLWYGSPWLATGVTSGNSASNHGTSSSFTGQFGVADTNSQQLELGIVLCDGSQTVSGLTQTKTWFNASSTPSISVSTATLSAYIMQNQGGGTGAANSGDIFSGSLTGSANWAVLCIPLVLMNQQASLVRIDWRTGTTPGAQTTWASEAAISANGMIVVAGMAGSGASVTAGPSAMADAAGNVYTFRNTTVQPVSGGVAWIATAPVTNALAAGTTGTINWGHASAAPNYTVDVLWAPLALGVDVSGALGVTGNGSAVSAAYTPASPNDMVIAFSTSVVTAQSWGGWAQAYNWIDAIDQSYLKNQLYAAQAIDLAAPSFTSAILSAPWATIMLGLTMPPVGTGGGAGGGANGPGYPGVWQFGAPGYTGGGKGGAGAPPGIAGPGGGASYPGGGGGGCYGTSAAPQEGGQGAPGALRLTWTPPLQAFNTLIVHSLNSNTDPNVNPITPIPITDVPNNTEYAVPSLNGILPATFNSTYTVMLSANYWNSATVGSARQITVTINQYEFPGGPKYSVQASRAVTPATDATNGLIDMGEVTLPVKDYLKYNDQSYFTISINDTDTSDRFMDVLMLDTLGQTVEVNIDPGQPGYGQYVNFFFDEATSDKDLGFVGGSMQDRQHQISVLDYTQVSGGAIYIGSGDNLFMVYSPSGAPNLSIQYAPRWYLDRSV